MVLYSKQRLQELYAESRERHRFEEERNRERRLKAKEKVAKALRLRKERQEAIERQRQADKERERRAELKAMRDDPYGNPFEGIGEQTLEQTKRSLQGVKATVPDVEKDPNDGKWNRELLSKAKDKHEPPTVRMWCAKQLLFNRLSANFP